MHESKPTPPTVLERLSTLEGHAEAHQTELNTLQQRISWLESRLSTLLGADCQWTPPPQPERQQIARIR